MNIKNILAKIKIPAGSVLSLLIGSPVERYERKILHIQTKLDKMCKKAGVSLVVVKGPETNNVVTLSFVPTASLEDKRKQERELFQEKLKEMQHWSPNRLLKWVPKKFQKEVTDMIKERGFKIRGRSKYGK